MKARLLGKAGSSDVHVRSDAVFGVVIGTLFFLVYTKGYMQRIGIPDNIVKIAVEFPVFLILLHLVNRGIWRPAPGFLLIVLYVTWAVLSAVYNGAAVQEAFLYCRYVVYAYIVFAAVWVTPLTRAGVARINLIIVLLFAVQIAASAHEVFLRGERVEAYVGTLNAGGGELATVFPLFAMGLTVPLYLCYRGNPLYLLLSWAFVLVGYASGKRAIYFYAPFLYALILGWHVLKVRTPLAFKRFLCGQLVFVCLVPLLLIGVSRSATIGESASKSTAGRVAYALHAAMDYTRAEGYTGNTRARTATSRRVLNTLAGGDFGVMCFGWGPTAVMGTGRRFDRLLIDYGITGWSRDVISIGWPGMVFYLLFYLYTYRSLRRHALSSDSTYWQAIRFGVEVSFIVFLICHLTYGTSYAAGGVLSYVYFYFLALAVSPQHEQLRRT